MKTLLFILLFSGLLSFGQSEELPYYELPEYPSEYTSGTVAGRMVDALGFRFYWASEGLREEDLSYRPNDESRSTNETLIHIFELSHIILNSTLKQPNSKEDHSQLTYQEIREQTLINLKTSADILKNSNDISEFKIIFGDQEIPFWNQINGPISDAIWHCGQIVSLRRSSGNPINSKVNHFRGTIRN